MSQKLWLKNGNFQKIFKPKRKITLILKSPNRFTLPMHCKIRTLALRKKWNILRKSLVRRSQLNQLKKALYKTEKKAKTLLLMILEVTLLWKITPSKKEKAHFGLKLFFTKWVKLINVQTPISNIKSKSLTCSWA